MCIECVVKSILSFNEKSCIEKKKKLSKCVYLLPTHIYSIHNIYLIESIKLFITTIHLSIHVHTMLSFSSYKVAHTLSPFLKNNWTSKNLLTFLHPFLSQSSINEEQYTYSECKRANLHIDQFCTWKFLPDNDGLAHAKPKTWD